MSNKIQDTPNRAAFDVRSAQDVREQWQKDPKAGLKAAAQQFETLFLQMVMKSMREATPQDGMLDSDQTRFYTALLDQQLAQNMATSGKGIGFAKLIEQQLGRSLENNVDPEQLMAATKAATAAASAANREALTRNLGEQSGAALPLSPTDGRHLQPLTVPLPSSQPSGVGGATVAPRSQDESALPASPNAFVSRIWPQAVEASRSTGIPPQFLVAHAALESGWGKQEMRFADGRNSFNLFGVKAGKSWAGDTVEAKTTEYVEGQAQQSVERFRAYGSYEEAFRDYAQLLRNNPRYSNVIASQDGTEFARRLQQAGYASDPQYAEKLSRIIAGPTLRLALMG